MTPCSTHRRETVNFKSKDGRSHHHTIQDLPDELFGKILFRSPEKLSTVCRRWYAITRDKAFWTVFSSTACSDLGDEDADPIELITNLLDNYLHPAQKKPNLALSYSEHEGGDFWDGREEAETEA